jgi:pyruvate dehydrogenase complex dehydrogenase (E1) component
MDGESVAPAVLRELARAGKIPRGRPAQATARYKLDLPVSEALS